VIIVDKRNISFLGIRLSLTFFIQFLQGSLIAFAAVTLPILIAIIFFDFSIKFNISDYFYVSLFLRSLAFLFVSLFEETLFRGYLISNLSETFNGKIPALLNSFYALIISSFLFAIIHLNNPWSAVLSTINIFLIGIIFGTAYLHFKSLALPIGMHFAWNFTLGNVYGLPVSGFSEDVSIFLVYSKEPNQILGGNFGPENSYLIILSILLIYFLITKLKSRSVSQTD